MSRTELWQQVPVDLYRALGVPHDASVDQIHNAWRSSAKAHHPDHGGSADDFHCAQVAFQVLSDPTQRMRYDLATRSPAPDPEWEAGFRLRDNKAFKDRDNKAFKYSDRPTYHAFGEPKRAAEPAMERWLFALAALMFILTVVVSFLLPVFTVIVGFLVIMFVGLRYAGYARRR